LKDRKKQDQALGGDQCMIAINTVVEP
jgi:hypothetical protein